MEEGCCSLHQETHEMCSVHLCLCTTSTTYTPTHMRFRLSVSLFRRRSATSRSPLKNGFFEEEFLNFKLGYLNATYSEEALAACDEISTALDSVPLDTLHRTYSGLASAILAVFNSGPHMHGKLTAFKGLLLPSRSSEQSTNACRESRRGTNFVLLPRPTFASAAPVSSLNE